MSYDRYTDTYDFEVFHGETKSFWELQEERKEAMADDGEDFDE